MAESVSNRQIFSVLKDVSVAIARVEGRVGHIEESNAELMKVVIKGNGRPPLTDRIQKIEDRHCNEDKNKKEVKEKKEKWGTRTWALISGVLLIAAGQAAALIVLFIRTGGLK